MYSLKYDRKARQVSTQSRIDKQNIITWPDGRVASAPLGGREDQMIVAISN